jgi:drug/metabolite transporter (DMT)-like permease
MTTDTTPVALPQRANALGAAAALSVVLIWATWLISTRYSLKTSLSPLDLSLLRYGLPALVLAPFWLKTGLWPKSVPKLPLVLKIGRASCRERVS